MHLIQTSGNLWRVCKLAAGSGPQDFLVLPEKQYETSPDMPHPGLGWHNAGAARNSSTPAGAGAYGKCYFFAPPFLPPLWNAEAPRNSSTSAGADAYGKYNFHGPKRSRSLGFDGPPHLRQRPSAALGVPSAPFFGCALGPKNPCT